MRRAAIGLNEELGESYSGSQGGLPQLLQAGVVAKALEEFVPAGADGAWGRAESGREGFAITLFGEKHLLLLIAGQYLAQCPAHSGLPVGVREFIP